MKFCGIYTEVSAPTTEMDIPAHMVPPNPDDSDSLYYHPLFRNF